MVPHEKLWHLSLIYDYNIQCIRCGVFLWTLQKAIIQTFHDSKYISHKQQNITKHAILKSSNQYYITLLAAQIYQF